MNFVNYHRRRLSLQKIIRALDLYHEGRTLKDIYDEVGTCNYNVLQWKTIEKRLREEKRLMDEVERLRSSINGLPDVPKYQAIIDCLKAVKNLNKHKFVSLKEKVQCLDLLKLTNKKITVLSRETGYPKSTISFWKKNENEIRKRAMEEEKEKESNDDKGKSVKEVSLIEKLYCLDLIRKKYYQMHLVKKATGFSIDQIREWCKMKKELQRMALDKENEKASSDVTEIETKHPWLPDQEKIEEEKESVTKKIDDKGFDDKGIDDKGIDDKGIDDKGIDDKGFDDKGIDDKGIDDKEVEKDKFSDMEQRENANDETLCAQRKRESVLRQQPIEIEPPKDTKYLKSTPKYRKPPQKQYAIHAAPLELKVKFVNFFKKFSFTSPMWGEILGFNRHSTRYYVSKYDTLRQRFAAKELRWIQRLGTLLKGCDHRQELIKLYKLCKCCNGLEMLDKYLTTGSVKVSLETGKRVSSSEIKEVVIKREKLVSAQISPDMKALFNDLYLGEYQLMYDICHRYAILSGLCFLPNKSYYHQKAKSEIEELRDHLQISLQRLISLHKMMCVE